MHNDYDPTNISKMIDRLRPLEKTTVKDKYDEEADLIINLMRQSNDRRNSSARRFQITLHGLR
jgi:hypothetical protein